MISVQNNVPELSIGSLTVSGLKSLPYDAMFEEWFAEQLRKAKESVAAPDWELRRNAVRSLLRTGGFKPSGRSKPAQEYLLRCLADNDFPRVNRAVDCLNVISVGFGLPISLLKLECFDSGATVRFGRSGESYVFNSVGQELDLTGLICVCGGVQRDQPIGTPVKDSLLGKISESTHEVIFFVYGPGGELEKQMSGIQEVESAARALKSALETWCC